MLNHFEQHPLPQCICAEARKSLRKNRHGQRQLPPKTL